MNVCVIPARGGSKRIPGKNIRAFAGRPMIAWAIESAQKSQLFERIVVSTDDEAVAKVAQAHGAEVPFERPAELADDFAPTVAVMVHAVEALKLNAQEDLVCCLYPGVPLLQPADLSAGLAALQADPNASYAASVVRYECPIERALRLGDHGRLQPCCPEHMGTRTQDLVPAYHDAGQFYWGRASAFAKQVPLLGVGTVAVVLPTWRVVDIDTPEDWTRAEQIFQGLAA